MTIIKSFFWPLIFILTACGGNGLPHKALEGAVNIAPENMNYGFFAQQGLKLLDTQKGNSTIDREWLSDKDKLYDRVTAEIEETENGLNVFLIESTPRYVYTYDILLDDGRFSLRHGGYDFILKRDFYKNIENPRLKISHENPDEGDKIGGILAYGDYKTPFIATIPQGNAKTSAPLADDVFFEKYISPLLRQKKGGEIRLNKRASDFFIMANLCNINFRLKKNLVPAHKKNSQIELSDNVRQKATRASVDWDGKQLTATEVFDYEAYVESSGSKDDFWHNQCHVPENAFFVSKPLYTPDNKFCVVDVIEHLKNYDSRSGLYIFKQVAGEWICVSRLDYDYKNYALLR